MTGSRLATGGADHLRGDLAICCESFGSPVAQALVSALMADLDERYAADGPGDGDAPDVAERFRVRVEQVTPPQGVFLVARLAGEPVGCGAVRSVIDGPPRVAEIKRMFTAPAVRGRGISRALLGRLEVEAAALGYRRLHLETGLRQPEAIRLYESAGYQPIPAYGQYAGDDLSRCFGKDLPLT